VASEGSFKRFRRREKPDQLDEVWFEVEREGWVVAYRLVPQGSALVVGELRILPAERGRDAGRWSGDPGRVPSGGVDSEALGIVRFGEHRQWWTGRIDEALRSPSLRAAVLGGVERARSVAEEAARHPGPKGRDDAFYARIARLYVEETKSGNRRPIATLAGLLNKSPAYVRDVLNTARDRRLLTRAGAGRAGGELTREARRLLREQEEEQ
jgi:hypothetical protein